jgi:mRNA-degrading endonuclease toxin of MazEF toxin-antitoxin module
VGNVLIPADESGLTMDSVANVSQLRTIDKARCQRRLGRVPRSRIQEVLDGISVQLQPRDTRNLD